MQYEGEQRHEDHSWRVMRGRKSFYFKGELFKCVVGQEGNDPVEEEGLMKQRRGSPVGHL